jgi:CRISPR/Cas system type I-B associated protein Csh2 (Cas7 group RAMP superfamily)
MSLMEATGLNAEEFAKMRKGVVSLRNNLIGAAQGER